MPQGLRHSLRSLLRAPLFCASVILTLTIGLGSAVAISAVVNAVLIRPLPYGHPKQLVGIWNDMAPLSMSHAQVTTGQYLTYRRYAHALDAIALYQEDAMNVTDPDGRAD